MRASLPALFAAAALAAALSAVPGAARAQYVAGGGGVALLGGDDVDTQTGYSLSIAAGHDTGLLRWELEGQFASIGDVVEVDLPLPGGGGVSGSLDADLYLLTLGAFFDLPVPVASPYVGGGIGWAWVTADGAVSASDGLQTIRETFDESDSGVALFAEAGLNFSVAPAVDLVPAIRYTYLDPLDGASNLWQVRLGLSVGF